MAGIPDGTALTVGRGLYERGGSDMEGRLHFASYGPGPDREIEKKLKGFRGRRMDRIKGGA